MLKWHSYCMKVGYAATAYNKETGQPVIGFDMGGISCLFDHPTRSLTYPTLSLTYPTCSTEQFHILYSAHVVTGTSTDVSRYAGHLEHVFETTTAGITIQAPQVRKHQYKLSSMIVCELNTGLYGNRIQYSIFISYGTTSY